MILCFKESVLTVSEICSNIETKKHKDKQISSVGWSSGNWKTIRQLKIFGCMWSFSEAFQAASSGWIDNLCPFVDSINQGWAIFKPVERGSHVLGICCICNQTDISQNTPLHEYFCYSHRDAFLFHFTPGLFLYISNTASNLMCWYTFVSPQTFI